MKNDYNAVFMRLKVFYIDFLKVYVFRNCITTAQKHSSFFDACMDFTFVGNGNELNINANPKNHE